MQKHTTTLHTLHRPLRRFTCLFEGFLPIDLAKHNVLSADEGDDVGDHVALAHKVQASQVEEARGADLAAVRLARAIGHEVHAKLALGRLDGHVCGAGRDRVAVRVELEVVDEGLHGVLHLRAARRADLGVVDADLACRHVVEALVDDADALAHLLAANEVAVIAVAARADGDVKLDAVVGIVGLRLAEIPGHAGATQHDTGEAVVEGLLGGDDANVNKALLPDAVAGQQLLHLVNALRELLGKLVDVLQETQRQVQGDAARPDIGGMHACAGDALVELHHLLALLEHPEERRGGADVEGVCGDGHDVVEQAGDLGEESADVLGAERDLDVEQFLHGERVGLLVGHHGDVVQTVKVGQRLEVGLVLDQLLRAAVQKSDVRIGVADNLAIQLQDQAQHTVGSRVLRAKVDGEVRDGLLRDVLLDLCARLCVLVEHVRQ
eukprot:m.75267 g.75267  ORF g.75267 m.75267 type:complete len:437 (+) comp14572_c0_seq1:246-1556(+)